MRPASTAVDVLALAREYGPEVAGTDLVFADAVPPELDALLQVLHTGVRAARPERVWWGCSSAKPRVVELSPRAVIPAGITLLAVEGDDRWDRIPPDARVDLPMLFAPDAAEVR